MPAAIQGTREMTEQDIAPARKLTLWYLGTWCAASWVPWSGGGGGHGLAQSPQRTLQTKEHQSQVLTDHSAMPKGEWGQSIQAEGVVRQSWEGRVWPFLELEVVQQGQLEEGEAAERCRERLR